jgi:hypothetical protein
MVAESVEEGVVGTTMLLGSPEDIVGFTEICREMDDE